MRTDWTPRPELALRRIQQLEAANLELMAQNRELRRQLKRQELERIKRLATTEPTEE